MEEDFELGIIVEIDNKYFVVHWPSANISWEDKEDLEKINENR